VEAGRETGIPSAADTVLGGVTFPWWMAGCGVGLGNVVCIGGKAQDLIFELRRQGRLLRAVAAIQLDGQLQPIQVERCISDAV
jgi:hypothetical protein